jgi:sugar phosphate isomerase/epimerase
LPGEWEPAIADAGALGFAGIELFLRQPTMADLLDHPERVASLRAADERAGVTLPSLGLVIFGPDFRLFEPDSTRRAVIVEAARRGIERCAELGGRAVLMPGAPPTDDPAAVDTYVTSLRDLASTAAIAGVRLGIETGYNAHKTREVLDRVGSPWVGDYFDTGNAAGRGYDPAAEIRARQGLLVQIHVKGIRGEDLAGGTVDLAGVRRALDDTGYDGWLMLETSAGDRPIEAAARNFAVMREYFA